MSLRQLSKRTLGEALWPLAGALTSRLLIGGDRGLILTFHYLGAPILKGVSEDLFLSPSEFAATLDFVRASLCPLDPEMFLTLLAKGTLPKGATLLTFDDCAETTMEEALPELACRNLKACFFANPGLMDAGRTVPALELMDLCRAAPQGNYTLLSTVIEIKDDQSRAAAYRALWPKIIAAPSRQHVKMFQSIREALGVQGISPSARLATWEGLDRLHDAGMLIANHTMFHSTVAADGVDQFTADVNDGYEALEARFGGSEKRIFCYPYGRPVDATAATTKSLKSLDTAFAFVTQGGIASKGSPLKLRREEASYSAGATKLAPLLANIR